jgi:hypothetical protein
LRKRGSRLFLSGGAGTAGDIALAKLLLCLLLGFDCCRCDGRGSFIDDLFDGLALLLYRLLLVVGIWRRRRRWRKGVMGSFGGRERARRFRCVGRLFRWSDIGYAHICRTRVNVLFH